MQQINEAYLILKDEEAKNRYDVEYWQFKAYQRQQEQFRLRGLGCLLIMIVIGVC